MPYDPRMLQMAQWGVGMMGPQAGPFDRAQQPRPWWEQPPPSPQQRPDDSNPSGQPATQPKPPPSLLDMMMSLGRMPRPQYDKATAGQSSPWGWLGSLGMPGGAGWGGGKG
jgi:hypothetical protein